MSSININLHFRIRRFRGVFCECFRMRSRSSYVSVCGIKPPLWIVARLGSPTTMVPILFYKV
ncbi:hypothetical protein AG1IA_05122 [Rhizoctonia solani AG-1 IA]|uniref:Uncharacterized protein n=1 Tax=Thanatephorus cucumeris (strain AG1-IA) TaxID=983506 RepID=L8WSA7_THACA|nr:hypothetical protein AG1IA_05122 [Rhizoctonia solani AG-1 IA]